MHTWLEKVFAGDDIPEFELNATSLSILYNLMKCNQHADRDTQLLIEDAQQKAEEYNMEGGRFVLTMLIGSSDFKITGSGEKW